jgi:hypothetical protein
MRGHEGFAVRAHDYGRKILLGVFCGLALAACAHPVRPMFNAHTIVISGRSTVGSDLNSATRKTLIVAARMTLDHGFRYFKIVGSQNAPSRSDVPLIRPGADVTIEVFREGEIDPRRPGVWDAQNIGAGRMPDGAR